MQTRDYMHERETSAQAVRVYPELYTNGYLFDYGANLEVTLSRLKLIPEVDVIWDQYVYLGSVYHPELKRKVKLYAVEDIVVQYISSDGIEG